MDSRRPLRGRSRYTKRLKRDIDFPRIRKEVSYVGRLGILLNQADSHSRDSVILSFDGNAAQSR